MEEYDIAIFTLVAEYVDNSRICWNAATDAAAINLPPVPCLMNCCGDDSSGVIMYHIKSQMCDDIPVAQRIYSKGVLPGH